MSKNVIIDGLAVELTRKRIKRINMRIKSPDGRICISAPYSVPESEIISFVRAKRTWIDRSIAKVKERAEEHPEPASKAEKEQQRRELKRRIAARLSRSQASGATAGLSGTCIPGGAAAIRRLIMSISA